MIRNGIYLFFAGLVFLNAELSVKAGFDDLLKKVPAGANTLVLIDVETTLTAPVAVKNGWGKQLEINYVERPVFLPPEATRLVLSAMLRSSADFARVWELAAMELSEPMSMRSIARAEGGYLDNIAGAPAAWTPSDAYFVSLGGDQLGVMFPAERQFVSRWVKFTQENTENRLSEYLQSAAKLVNQKVPILLAMDLRDVVHLHEIEKGLQESEFIKKEKLDISQAVEVLASLQGAVLRVAVGADVQGQLRIDFQESIAPIKTVAKELVLDALGDLGAPVDDIKDWKLELEEKAITMRGPLSKHGQRRVFSIVEIPSTKFSTLKGVEMADSKEVPESRIREASQTYFKSIQVLFRDLRRDLQGNKAVAAVLERYARQIGRMPILHVDQELLDYGATVANTLRSVALAKRQGGIQAGVATAGMGGGGYSSYSNYSTGYYGTGYVPAEDLYAGARRSAADRTRIKAEAMADSKRSRVEGKQYIEELSASVRRRMTEKYGVEF